MNVMLASAVHHTESTTPNKWISLTLLCLNDIMLDYVFHARATKKVEILENA